MSSRDVLPDDLRQGAPGWRWRWWIGDDDWEWSSHFQTTTEMYELTLLNWGTRLETALAGAEVAIYRGHTTEAAEERLDERAQFAQRWHRAEKRAAKRAWDWLLENRQREYFQLAHQRGLRSA